MPINKTLDLAIKKSELGGEYPELVYKSPITGREYPNYVDNQAWDLFVENVQSNEHANAYAQYRKSSGDELGLKKNNVSPPKMACYGSSSRMIYNLSKDIDGFRFEEKLGTTVGGTANMDGYYENAETMFFIEAKCREPYTAKSHKVPYAYKRLYERINQDGIPDFTIELSDIDQKKMAIEFKLKGKVVEFCDVKQMICHLLGVATKVLRNPTDKKISFLYLLFDPTKIEIDNAKAKAEIYRIYEKTCREVLNIPLAKLFRSVLIYLNASKVQADAIVKNFSFTLCNQGNYNNHLK